MKNYMGVLGDPAKIETYGNEFYELPSYDIDYSLFYLLGASENDVPRHHYHKMYDNFINKIGLEKLFPEIIGLTKSNDRTIRSRLGLFPSSPSQLISGPGFAFAPYPINTRSRFLKFKAKLLRSLLSPFLPFDLIKLAYLPLGGKAANKTQADTKLDDATILDLFYNMRFQNRFEWYYLEAGSGQNLLDPEFIQSCLVYQAAGINHSSPQTIELNLSKINTAERIIVPRSIYGGGISNPKHLKSILSPEGDGAKLVPQVIIIGNISENNLKMTYNLVDELQKINQTSARSTDILL